jgi:hypothetical protein
MLAYRTPLAYRFGEITSLWTVFYRTLDKLVIRRVSFLILGKIYFYFIFSSKFFYMFLHYIDLHILF